jgi:single-strand DNA-binding protein
LDTVHTKRDNTLQRCTLEGNRFQDFEGAYNMSSSVNKALIVGYLGSSPEIQKTSSGSDMAIFSVATNSHWNDQNQNVADKTEWHRIVVFGRKAEIASRYLARGSQVAVEGSLRTNKWTDDTGNDRWSTEIHITDFKGNFTMLGGRDSGLTNHDKTSEASQEGSVGHEEDILCDFPF